MEPVDDARRPPRRDAGHRLGVGQIRVHPRGRIAEEHPQELVGLGGVASVAGHEAGRREGGDAIAERVHGLPMGDEVVGIGLAVATDVGQAVGLRGIGPPVVAVGLEVVRGALGVRGAVSRDREWRQREGGVGGREDPLAVEAGHVDRHRR